MLMIKMESTKRDDILAATLDLIVTYDIQATAMSRIAKQANVGMGTIYNYFESKDVLLYELFQIIRAKLAEAIFAAYPDNGTPQEQFTHVWRTMCHHYLAHPKEFLFGERFAASPYMTAQLMAESAERWSRLNTMFVKAREQKVIKDIPLEFFLPMVHGAFGALIRNHISGIQGLDQTVIEMAIDTFWDAIKYEA